MAENQAGQDPQVRRLGQAALNAIEALLDDQPVQEGSEEEKAGVYEALSGAARCLVALRDHLIEQRRAGQAVPPERLERVNSIVSLASSAEYPLVGLRWNRVCLMRDTLRDFLGQPEATDQERRK